MRVSKDEFKNRIDECLEKAENDEDVVVVEGDNEIVYLVKAAKYNMYKPQGHEFDWYSGE